MVFFNVGLKLANNFILRLFNIFLKLGHYQFGFIISIGPSDEHDFVIWHSAVSELNDKLVVEYILAILRRIFQEIEHIGQMSDLSESDIGVKLLKETMESGNFYRVNRKLVTASAHLLTNTVIHIHVLIRTFNSRRH